MKIVCTQYLSYTTYQSRFAVRSGKKSPNQETGLGNRGHLVHISEVVFCKVVSTQYKQVCFFQKFLIYSLRVLLMKMCYIKRLSNFFCRTQGRNWLPKTGWAIAHPAHLPVMTLHNPLKHCGNSKFERVKGSHLKKKLLQSSPLYGVLIQIVTKQLYQLFQL